ncbi:transcriptional regulator, partial [Campylobacter jejuni]|nr:transcriptional regulator [Campylobacter jejuni]
MLFTKASEYALLSLIYISQKETPQDVDSLALELDIPKSFLAKILQTLAKDGLLKSFKGAKGGFVLI